MYKCNRSIVVLIIALFIQSVYATAQTRKGDVVTSVGYSANFYRGEFVSGRAGDGAMLTLAYNTSDRLWIEGRIGFGAYNWETNAGLVSKYADYYGSSASFGGNYPGSLTKISSRNESNLTTLDVTFGFVLLQNRSFTPFVSGGFGMVNFSPRTTSDRESLPNYERGAYPSSVASIPLGVGVMIPIADQLSLSARYDHRIVFSGYLDDYEVGSSNDGLSALTIGLSYRFNERDNAPTAQGKGRYWCEQCSTWYDVNNCAICAAQNCEICKQRRAGQGDDLADAAPTPEAPAVKTPEPPATPEPAIQPEEPKPAPPVKESEPAAAVKKKLSAQGIRFNVNSDVIDFTDPTTKARMDEMLDYMTQACDDLEVLVEGHASVDGPAKRNQELSVLRARAIARWLQENGVPSERIKGSIGYGSAMPKVPDPAPSVARKMTKQQLEAIREQNRRIELSILKDCE
ncbi:MAG: OmpA family protein [Ignavibacteria bacterium]|jgi:outer membrane protein OmpA-like peptidoglycan-associated protein